VLEEEEEEKEKKEIYLPEQRGGAHLVSRNGLGAEVVGQVAQCPGGVGGLHLGQNSRSGPPETQACLKPLGSWKLYSGVPTFWGQGIAGVPSQLACSGILQICLRGTVLQGQPSPVPNRQPPSPSPCLPQPTTLHLVGDLDHPTVSKS
jgi:hypothetical protein